MFGCEMKFYITKRELSTAERFEHDWLIQTGGKPN